MTRAELLAEINAYAAEIGQPSVPDPRLDDWRDEDLLPEPARAGRGRARGVQRDWGDDALAAARHILRLQSMGERRASQHLAYLWLIGGPQTISQARRAVSSEFGRMVRRRRRSVPAAGAAQTPFAQRALRRRVGPLDPHLASMVGAGSDGHPITESLAVAGLPGLFGDPAEPMSVAILAAFPGLGALAAAPWIKEFLDGYEGYFGLRDETDQSAIAVLDEATDAEWEAARERLQMNYVGLGFAISVLSAPNSEAEKALLSIDRSEGAIAFFVQHLNGIRKSKNASKNRRQIE